MQDIGIYVFGDTKLCLGDNVSSIQKFLKDTGIKYHSSIDLLKDNINKSELENLFILIIIDDSGLEIRVENGIIHYIKSYNLGNTIGEIADTEDPANILIQSKDLLASKLNTNSKNLTIKTFNADIIRIVYELEAGLGGKKISISIAKSNTTNELYIETLEYV